MSDWGWLLSTESAGAKGGIGMRFREDKRYNESLYSIDVKAGCVLNREP